MSNEQILADVPIENAINDLMGALGGADKKAVRRSIKAAVRRLVKIDKEAVLSVVKQVQS